MSVVRNSVIVDGRVADIVWRSILAPWRHAQGARPVRPEIQEFCEDVRLAASLYGAELESERTLRTNLRTSADTAAGSNHEQISTADLADALGFGERHARRFAAAHGVEPAGRNRWRRVDVATLLDARNVA